jgi:hypothetical protein
MSVGPIGRGFGKSFCGFFSLRRSAAGPAAISFIAFDSLPRRARLPVAFAIPANSNPVSGLIRTFYIAVAIHLR